jgi:phage-related protein
VQAMSKCETLKNKEWYVSLLNNFCNFMASEKITYREVIFFKDCFRNFFSEQSDPVKEKIMWTLKLISDVDRVPESYFKHIENTCGLYEVRVQSGNDIFRIFSFFDKGRLVVLTNGFRKKTQKTPRKEIIKALKIKEEYEREKQTHDQA